MGLNGLMWWIDRWRKSTAYIDMTLEEQGAYRNLLDEACLRGGPIPNDERVLARACGDVMAWKRVKAAVLAHFTLTPDGYRNETLDDVVRKTQLRIDKQKRYRNKKGNGPGNARGNEHGNGVGNAEGNEAGNEQGYLDPDPDRELSEELESSRRGRARVFNGKRLKVSQAQHQVVLDELGAAVSLLDLLALYALWDAELVLSGDPLDVLPFVKAKAVAAVKAAQVQDVPPEVDWFEECKQQHAGRCGGRLRHHNQMAIDEERARLHA
jgi:Uncharacterized protein conserved in bacteria